MAESDLTTAGRETIDIVVSISPRSIELFSQGLYRSPHKAIEELVANAYDAGATSAHIIMQRAKSGQVTSIVVVDDGTGMDGPALQQHWLIGESQKREAGYTEPGNRKPIGKFGIGKLATFVLARHFTHVSKRGKNYFAATMDYDRVSSGSGSRPGTSEKSITFPVRELSASEARTVLKPFTNGTGPGYDAIRLFGPNAATNWTAAILTDPKPLADQLKEGTLRWVLSTAMPMGSSFALYLDGNKVESSKSNIKPKKIWTLGKDFVPKTAGFTVAQNTKVPTSSSQRFIIRHALLGHISGTIEVYKDPITGKPDSIGRNNGFFVYVRERLVNEDDLYFGIPESKLRHGTLSRFRMSVRVDGLDDDLLSSREDVQRTVRLEPLHELFEEAFNVARTFLRTVEDENNAKTKASDRLAGSPRSSAVAPLLAMIEKVVEQKITPFLSRVDPVGPSDRTAFLRDFRQKLDTGNFFSVTQDALSPDNGIALLDVTSSTLTINTQHPFVATFLDDFNNSRSNEPLELFVVGEVLLEATLYEMLSDVRTVRELVERRDALLRSIASDSKRRSASLIAINLWESRNAPTAFEYSIADAFSSMGFVARRIGGPGKVDGIAEARLSGTQDEKRAYSISLEAKTVETSGKKIDHSTVKVSTVVRHRDLFQCDYALVIGESFTDAAGSALLSEVEERNQIEITAGSNKRITLIRLADLQRLVRLMPVKMVRLDRLREMFALGKPDAVGAFIDRLESEEKPRKNFTTILEEIAALQQDRDNQPIEYGALQVGLRLRRNLDIDQPELIDDCKAMHVLSGGLVYAHPAHVELNQNPDFIIDVIAGTIREYPIGMREIANEVFAPSTPAKRNTTKAQKKPSKRTAAKKKRKR